MSLPKPPKIPESTKQLQAQQLQAEQERRRQLKEKQLQTSKGILAGGGQRSLISSSSGRGFGRNFLA
jgi:hypothetical protein